MLRHVSPERLPYEWETIGPVLAPAIALDPARDMRTVQDNALSGHWHLWHVGGSQRGYVVTECLDRTMWIIYAAGNGAGIADKRALMKMFEALALSIGCEDVRFEGRDWRRVFRDYEARKGDDGRWNFRKKVS
jgi:hypothetical protein